MKFSKTALITGAAGFIGFHVCKKFLSEGWKVIGLDNMSEYYDVTLKQHREDILLKFKNYQSVRGNVEDPSLLMSLFEAKKPDIVVHLAAQAGVRYSIDNPRAYLESNIVGTFELLEAARYFTPSHVLIASTSSTYGANKDTPFVENSKTDHQMSFYAATKKSTENIAHSYSHLFNIPVTMFRFFTVYGPWGRPDMALFKFTKAILSDQPIDVYNYGDMVRDFTYIDDLVRAIGLLAEKIPLTEKQRSKGTLSFDSLSPVAPFRVVNIGNSSSVPLIKFIAEIEKVIGKEAKKNFKPMQAGDVPSTLASNKLLRELTNFSPNTNVEVGIKNFIDWYRFFYKV